jgi:hypothetical protein
MNTLSDRMPRASGFKTLIGTLIATLALAGAVRVAVPAPASAAESLSTETCDEMLRLATWAGTNVSPALGRMLANNWEWRC